MPRLIQAGQKSQILLHYPFKTGLISLFLEGAAQLSSTGGSQTEADAEVYPPGNEVPCTVTVPATRVTLPDPERSCRNHIQNTVPEPGDEIAL